MIPRPAAAVFGLAVAATLAIAACSAGATSAPSAAAGSPSAAAATSPSPSSAIPSISIPSALASALASAGGTTPDAATLVSADMAASVIGGSPSKVTPPMSIPNVSLVSYGTGSGDSVTVFIETVPGGIASTQLQAAIALAGVQGQLQTVSGLGDAAGKVVDANEATVAFVKGNELVVVSAQSATKAGTDLEPKVEALAKQIAGKL